MTVSAARPGFRKAIRFATVELEVHVVAPVREGMCGLPR